jgi:hypothetical protein
MSMKIGINFKLLPLANVLGSRGLLAGGRARAKFTAEVARLCDEYVPFRDGPLKNNHTVSATQITYHSPYAKSNYYGNGGHGKQGTAGGGKRGKLWDQRMYADKKESLVKAIEGFIRTEG